MSGHHSTISRAVAELAENTSASRHALYDRIRTELIKELESRDPPLAESEIRRQRLAFEWALREVEADQASLATLSGAFTDIVRARDSKAGHRAIDNEVVKRDPVPPAPSTPPAAKQGDRAPPRTPETDALLRKLDDALKDIDLKRASLRANEKTVAPQEPKPKGPTTNAPADELVKKPDAPRAAPETKGKPDVTLEKAPPSQAQPRELALLARAIAHRPAQKPAAVVIEDPSPAARFDPPSAPATRVAPDQPARTPAAVTQPAQQPREAESTPAHVAEYLPAQMSNGKSTATDAVVDERPEKQDAALQATQPKPAEPKPAEPKPAEPKLAESKPAPARQPASVTEAMPPPVSKQERPETTGVVDAGSEPKAPPSLASENVAPPSVSPIDPPPTTPAAIQHDPPIAPDNVARVTPAPEPPAAPSDSASPQAPHSASVPAIIPAQGALSVAEVPRPAAEPADATVKARVHPRLQAMVQAARYHGIELDVTEFRAGPGEREPSPAALSLWAQNAGMWSRAMRIRWRHLLKLNDAGPVVLLFTDGSAGLLAGTNAAQSIVFLKDPFAPDGTAPVPVDELRLSEVWAGEAVLLRASRGVATADAPFNLRWLAGLVLHERRTLRDIALASLTISFLTIFPPLIVMTMVNKVLQFRSISTLVLLSVMMVVVVLYETLLGHARRLIVSVIGARLDARLNLHIFNRLLRLPLDYFERHPSGETMYKIAQIHRVREFLTGRLLTTLLDLITLCVLFPFLFYLNATLTWFVVGCAVVITLIILAFLKPLREMYSRVAAAETWKSAALGETIAGIKTVKALALEPQRRALWDERLAEAGKWRLAFGRLANWPQTLVTPVERFMVIGTMMLGAYIAMNDTSGYLIGSLFAFLMLSQRVAQPLVGLARLVEDYEEVNAAIGEAGSVLNRPLEAAAGVVGLRPKFVGEISFQDVTFTYTGTAVPALDRVSFSVPAGSMLGIVGRSGSGKSTITRLLQGINRDYRGFVKIDGSDLREIDLRHLRQSLGVVLQNNFLFRGSIRDNVIAGRPGLTLADAVHAARLAGAEEFIERMPNGYETYIEEGSPNLSGGQTQRLAIARALIHDPRFLILDEATSALDPESEAVVNANLMRIGRGRTMVLVSHRLSSLVECDQILVMEQGKVVDVAPHKVLLERCAIYRQLWAQQNRHSENQGSRQAAVAPRLVSGG